MKRIVIDTDPGIDDAAAILFALARPELKVEMLTTVYGNVDLAKATSNAQTILEVSGVAGIPVVAGVDRPLTRLANYATAIHGYDGLAGLSRQQQQLEAGRAPRALIECVRAAPGEITIVALGPLTNIALAILQDSSFAAAVKRIVVMGGAVLTWGNASPAASANLLSDPEAAAIVYESGADIIQVGLDVCRRAAISGAQLSRVRASGSDAATFLWDLGSRHWSLRPGAALTDTDLLQMNDAVCIAYLVQPSLFGVKALTVRIETEGQFTAGCTVADFDNVWNLDPNVKVCLDIDEAGYSQFFTESLMRI